MDLLKAKWCDAVLVESFGPTQISSGLVGSSSCDAHVTPLFFFIVCISLCITSSDVTFLYLASATTPNGPVQVCRYSRHSKFSEYTCFSTLPYFFAKEESKALFHTI